ncbi:sn1-specific diacylglycerol lipase alpha [Phtheirospermum japonicum]|uniref:Sn1-specific diacylglycerol lipase alpha n=1 Tax=Phtheirospermum japonicum TaxID=374723 RepID=A0A830D0M5_9LAMI|nr:sn1-specific diacylglycerol lipase alpha [Phtheirospermum japonicum]
MAATTVATAAGAVVLLYYVVSRRISSAADGEDSGGGGDFSESKSRSAKKRLSRRPAQAPATWLETISTLSETLRFTYSETLGKWPIGDLAFGINYLIRRQGNLQVASVYAGENAVQLKGPEVIDQLYYYLKLLTLCMLFSKKPFPVFLETAGLSESHVLLQKPKAGILKPAFTILRDETSKCFLLLIRGTHSIKDTLTAVTGAVVPFHHSVLDDGGISNLVLGYAHCGMVAAARWIAKLSTPSLLKAIEQNPDYDVKIVGHSLGGGTAALLTYILREQKEFSSTTCVTFAPAASMTWELAESGKHFITTIVNGSDLVPTFSAASIDDLRSEVTASSWLNDLRDQVEGNRVLNVIYRSATALGSRLPSISNAKARVVGAGALLRPVSSSTRVVIKRAQDVAEAVVKTRSSISSWTCMGPRRRPVTPRSNANTNDLPETPLIIETTTTSESYSSEIIIKSSNPDPNKPEYCSSSSSSDETDEEDKNIIRLDNVVTTTSTTIEEITEGQLWYELEKELQRRENEVDERIQEEEEAVAKEITEEEKVFADAVESRTPISSSDDDQKFYPPGRIMHIISVPNSVTSDDGVGEEKVGIYETERELYSKLRLSRTMINDHYMPMYKKMMELLIKQLEDELDSSLAMRSKKIGETCQSKIYQTWKPTPRTPLCISSKGIRSSGGGGSESLMDMVAELRRRARSSGGVGREWKELKKEGKGK